MTSATLHRLAALSAARPWRRPRPWSPTPPRTPSFVVRHRLAGCGLLLLTVVAGYVVADTRSAHEKPHAIIKEAATRYGVSEELIAAVIEAESQFYPRAVSRRGAQGLMQLMPATAATLGVEDPFSPRDNIDGGVRHLRTLIDRFDNNLPLALAAYNAGEVAVRVHKGIPPYPQTRAYVKKIMARLERNAAKAPAEWTRPRVR
jgi:soluble lytic murein transglycosylase-like protein